MTAPLPRILRAVRQIGGAAAVCLTAAAVGVLPSGSPAGAIEGEKITYEAKPGSRLEQDFTTPMAPTDGGTIHSPDECGLVTWCTRVPIEIIPPANRGATEDYVVVLSVAWEADDVETPDNIGGKQESNDLDVYLYHRAPVLDDEGNPEKNEDGTTKEDYVETGRSASGQRPEVIKLFRPEEIEYHLVVVNFVGVNRGFTVTLEFQDAAFTIPGITDDAGSSPSAAGPSFTPPASAPSNSLALGGGGAAPQVAPAAPELPSLAPSVSDDDFGFADEIDASLLEADEPTRNSLFAEEEIRAPEPVTGASLALWLGLLPLALLGGILALVIRRRPSALRMQLPSRSARGGAAAVADA